MNDLQIVTEIPKDLGNKAIEAAVQAFIKDSHIEDMHVDAKGFYQQTLESIASATYFKSAGKFLWLAWHEGQVLAYCLSSVSRDVDARLTYHLEQAWVRKDIRRHPIVKTWYELFRTHAKQLLCSHITVVSCRSTKAYLRFLGANWHQYFTVLKEDI